MTTKEKQHIRENARSIPPGAIVRGGCLFMEEIGGQMYWFYNSEEEGKYWYESSGTRKIKERHREREQAKRRTLRDKHLH